MGRGGHNNQVSVGTKAWDFIQRVIMSWLTIVRV